MVRVVALLALVCGAAAVLDASSTPFGASVLAELESKIAQGQPLDELKAILADIRQRLQEAGDADLAAQAADDTYCENRETKLVADIALEQQQIESITSKINSDQQIVNEKTALMAKLKIEIDDLTRKIALNVGEQAERKSERAEQKKQFEDGTTDVGICVDAINEIEALGGVARLVQQQGDSAANYQEGVTALLEQVSTRVTHPNVLNLVQLSALSARQLPQGDVDRLNGLLAQLKEDLIKYGDDIATDEGVLADLYATTMAALVELQNDDETDKAQKIDERQDAATAKTSALARIKANTVELEESQASKKAIEEVLADLKSGCTDRKLAHEDRVDERKEEVETIDAIETILTEKLGKHFNNDHLSNNVTTSVGATEEGRSYTE